MDLIEWQRFLSLVNSRIDAQESMNAVSVIQLIKLKEPSGNCRISSEKSLKPDSAGWVSHLNPTCFMELIVYDFANISVHIDRAQAVIFRYFFNGQFLGCFNAFLFQFPDDHFHIQAELGTEIRKGSITCSGRRRLRQITFLNGLLCRFFRCFNGLIDFLRRHPVFAT